MLGITASTFQTWLLVEVGIIAVIAFLSFLMGLRRPPSG